MSERAGIKEISFGWEIVSIVIQSKHGKPEYTANKEYINDR
jgi:hypothetical protein